MKMKYLSLLAVLLFMVSCSSKGSLAERDPTTMTKEEISAIFDKAEKKRMKASKLGHEWRFTAKHIKEGRELLENGENVEAFKKGERALYEAETAIWQAKESRKVWKLAVP